MLFIQFIYMLIVSTFLLKVLFIFARTQAYFLSFVHNTYLKWRNDIGCKLVLLVFKNLYSIFILQAL